MKKNEEIKKEIINKTSELIRQNSEITIKDIANACFVNIAAVNYYFGSKDHLISIVIDQIIDELKEKVSDEVKKIKDTSSLEDVLEMMINFIYNFALENIGVVGYLFLQKDKDQSQLINAFFSDNEFTRFILNHLSKSTGIIDIDILYARYVLLFSCFSIPLFIQLLREKDTKFQYKTLYDSQFKKLYVQELLRIVR